MTAILGISALFHDSAACLMVDGKVVAAAQEERFSRTKYDARFPRAAVAYCLEEAGIAARDLDFVAFYEKPFLKFERILENHANVAPRAAGSFGEFVERWLKERLDMERYIREHLPGEIAGEIVFARHHESHAASAFYTSGFHDAAILTADAVGEFATTGIALGSAGDQIELLREIRYPHSLGMLYSAFTQYLGFRVNSGEYKVMGLAPYGNPRFVGAIRDRLVEVRDDGSFTLNLEYFAFPAGRSMTNARFHDLFQGPPRRPGAALEQRHMDVAASIQAVTEEILLRLAREAHRLTGLPRLCMAGGVALNCVANSRILKEGPFEDVYVFPAAGDAGGAVGAALLVWHRLLGQPRNAVNGRRFDPFLGPAFDDVQIGSTLDFYGARYHQYEKETDLLEETARLIDSGKVIGWFQGRMEFGPRALGARSILGDARDPEMQRRMNLKVKFRESFRPFAPAVLAERAGEYFDSEKESPYMLFVAQLQPAHQIACKADLERVSGLDKLSIPSSDLPAITHVDFSARLQTVSESDNPRFYRLLKAFERRTGWGVIINTSFNIRGEPIVCTPEEAYRCFMFTDMDALVVGNHILHKGEQPALPGASEFRKQVKRDEPPLADGQARGLSRLRLLAYCALYYLLFTPAALLFRILHSAGAWKEGLWREASHPPRKDEFLLPY